MNQIGMTIIFLIVVFINEHNMAHADELTTPMLIEETLQGVAESSCLHYQVIGLCFWLKCDGIDCHVKTTAKVSHYLPDTVVSVYRDNHSNPWDYAKSVIDPLSFRLGQMELRNLMGSQTMGFGNENFLAAQSQNNLFKEADVLGNPALTFFQAFPDFFLPTFVKAFKPYYLSMADSELWRSPLKEMLLYPQYLIPGVRDVGTILDDWGGVFPRVGFIQQSADAKAAAVIATRALDIAAELNQPHLYQALPNSCGEHCRIKAVHENSVDANTWQMVYPMTDHQCTIFGKNDLTHSIPWGNQAYQKGQGNYVWVVWRHYQGCIPGKGQYLGEINF